MYRHPQPMEQLFWKRILHQVRPYRGSVILSVIAQLTNTLMLLGAGVLFKPMLDATLAGHADKLQRLLLIPFVLILPVGVLILLGTWAHTRFVTNAVQDFRNDLAQQVQRLPMSRIDRENTGDLMTRLNSGTDALTELLDSLPVLLVSPVSLLGGLAAMLYLSWPLAVLTLLMALPSIWMSRRIAKPVEALAHDRAECEGEATAILQDALSGVAVVKTYGLRATLMARLTEVYAKIGRLTDEAERHNVMGWLSFFVAQILPQMVLWLAAGAFAVGGQLTAGGVFAITYLAYIVVSPIGQGQQWLMRLSFTRSVIQRAFDIFNMPTETDGKALSRHHDSTTPLLALDAVHFRYGDELAPVLRDVSLQVFAGRTVALVGASGGGKSSVIKLACGFYAPQSGEVRLLGQSLATLDPDSARQVMALMSQDTYLFPGTIADNIGQGRPGASFDEIVAAARAAHADAFIREQPEGYQTPVGERGVRLSGGQRQRIALARAILKDAPILLLDEPTAALDTESERLIQQALTQFGQGRATLVVAHRLSTIRGADEILVLEDGTVVERGTHAELIAANGTYCHLVAQQLEAA